MNFPKELKYTEEHEWARKDGDQVVIGITDYAQSELGDVVYLDLPSVGNHFKQNESFGSIEAVKAASDLYMPVSGEITEVNAALADTPETINADPYGDGWIFRIQPEDDAELEDLMDADAYAEQIAAEE